MRTRTGSRPDEQCRHRRPQSWVEDMSAERIQRAAVNVRLVSIARERFAGCRPRAVARAGNRERVLPCCGSRRTGGVDMPHRRLDALTVGREVAANGIRSTGYAPG
jgi:hypothetical protein